MSTQPEHRPSNMGPAKANLAITLDEISIGDVISTLWQRKWLIIASVVCAMAIAITYLHFATYRYTASITVFPVGNERSGLGGTLGRLGDLASLGGISLPTDQGAIPFIQYAEGLRSYHTAEQISKNCELMIQLFNDEWNDEIGQFQEPEKLVYNMVRFIKSALGVPVDPWSPPGAARVHRILQESLSVNEESKKPIIRVAWEHPNGQLAAEFIENVHDAVDSNIRMRAKKRAEENIAYIGSQLETVQLAEHRAALAQALSEQEKLLMSASASVPYAAEPTGSATISNRPTSPRPVLVLALAIVAGGFVGIAITLLSPRRAGE